MDTAGRHPGTAQAVRGLAYDHLPQHLQTVSRPFHDLAALDDAAADEQHARRREGR